MRPDQHTINHGEHQANDSRADLVNWAALKREKITMKRKKDDDKKTV
jgi:hypothetical protein